MDVVRWDVIRRGRLCCMRAQIAGKSTGERCGSPQGVELARVTVIHSRVSGRLCEFKVSG